jgi:hypothetical protein
VPATPAGQGGEEKDQTWTLQSEAALPQRQSPDNCLQGHARRTATQYKRAKTRFYDGCGKYAYALFWGMNCAMDWRRKRRRDWQGYSTVHTRQ